VVALAGVFALSAPFAAFAGGGTPTKPSLVPVATKVGGPTAGKQQGTYISPGLLEQAQAHGNQRLRVIIQASAGTSAAASAFSKNGGTDGGKVAKRLTLVGGVAVELKAKWIARLAKIPGLVITADAPVQATGNGAFNTQHWPYVSGIARLWGNEWQPAPDAPTIAIVDSGLDAGNPDFAGRDYPQINLSSLTPSAQGDGDGHGTFVAGIAADGRADYTGASPTSHILPIRVMDDNGTARTSDVIAAAQWILANKDTYNIKVANFSLHSSTATHFFFDPLDRAVEKLWFNGVVVVAASGNYGTSDGPSGVLYSPGNDPFVITVGAVDIGSEIGREDDTVAPWSAWGLTEDGFAKPELGAPGVFMVGPVSDGTLAQQRPDHVVSPGYMELSGTSFSAPVVAGAAAQILARHPDWSADQVKGALMLAARPAPSVTGWEIGVGEVRASRSATVDDPPNPNAALDQFVAADPVDGPTFDAPAWVNTVLTDASWSDASWSDASWSDASWSDASWSDASWSDASWSDASWSDASWSDASWSDASWPDASWSDAAESEPVGAVPTLDFQDLLALQNDPDLALPPAADTIAALSTELHH
jgi:serine protease AprX